MSKFLKRVTSGLCVFVLAGCASKVVTSIETFRNPSLEMRQGATVAVVAENQTVGDSLEFQYYQEKTLSQFNQLGYSTADVDTADYLAYLGYGAEYRDKDRGRTRVYWGGGYGHGFRSRVSGNVILADSYEQDEYQRFVSLKVEENVQVNAESDAVENKVFALNATSNGHCEHLSAVFDEMLEAIFANLNQPSGSIVNASVESDVKCR